MPKGVHQYKFIIDNVWKISKDYPTINDGSGNVNNYIDNTELQKKSFKIKKYAKDDLIEEEVFNNYFPKKMELNTDAPLVPPYYQKTINIEFNSEQVHLGNMRYIIRDCFQYNSINNSVCVIQKPPSINM